MPNNHKSEYQERLERLKNIRSNNINPYPDKFKKTKTVAQALAAKEGTKNISLAGRMLTIRKMGKIIFVHLLDETGKMQLVVKEDTVGKDDFKQFTKIFDAADFIGVTGEIFTTQKGELSLLVKKYTLLSKTLRPLPEKWHGLKDQEALYRQRYLDLIANPDTKERFLFRSNFIKTLREFYWSKGFVEVETPILSNTASGAIAKPFTTHHNALDIDLYLRIAPETYLKECVVGGFEKVFELGRLFRNEGMDPSHLQDYTSVEHYVAYWNYEDNMKFTEEMFSYLLDKLIGSTKLKLRNRDGKLVDVDFTPPWNVVTFAELIKKDSGIDINKYETVEELLKAIKAAKIEIEDEDTKSRGSLIDALYKRVSRPKIIKPTFLTQHPIDISPLARRNDADPNIVDRFQLVVNGWEIINAYSELVDPVDQADRFNQQAKAKKAGDEEAHGKDDEFVKALEHGAPPMSGWGMGVDRIVALLTQQENLRDVVLFPLMKPND